MRRKKKEVKKRDKKKMLPVAKGVGTPRGGRGLKKHKTRFLFPLVDPPFAVPIRRFSFPEPLFPFPFPLVH